MSQYDLNIPTYGVLHVLGAFFSHEQIENIKARNRKLLKTTGTLGHTKYLIENKGILTPEHLSSMWQIPAFQEK